jgi:hypothetical protein
LNDYWGVCYGGRLWEAEDEARGRERGRRRYGTQVGEALKRQSNLGAVLQISAAYAGILIIGNCVILVEVKVDGKWIEHWALYVPIYTVERFLKVYIKW